MQAVLYRLQPVVPPLRLQHHPDMPLALRLHQLQGHPHDPQLSPQLNWIQAFLCANFVHGPSWKDFFELADGSCLTQERQKALLRTCLTTELRATLAHAIPVANTTRVDELLNAIGANFRRQRNIALSCVQFEERKQQHGETFDNFFVGLKELASDADLCSASDWLGDLVP